MASEGSSGQIPSANLLQGSQVVDLVSHSSSGKALPVNVSPGNSLPAAGNAVPSQSVSAGANGANGANVGNGANGANASAAKPRSVDPQTLIDQLNKNLNDSGRPDQFRLDPTASNLIQQINPANGAVVGQFSVDEFPALARSVGMTGLIVNSHA
jgi:hypothetical protein